MRPVGGPNLGLVFLWLSCCFVLEQLGSTLPGGLRLALRGLWRTLWRERAAASEKHTLRDPLCFSLAWGLPRSTADGRRAGERKELGRGRRHEQVKRHRRIEGDEVEDPSPLDLVEDSTSMDQVTGVPYNARPPKHRPLPHQQSRPWPATCVRGKASPRRPETSSPHHEPEGPQRVRTATRTRPQANAHGGAPLACVEGIEEEKPPRTATHQRDDRPDNRRPARHQGRAARALDALTAATSRSSA